MEGSKLDINDFIDTDGGIVKTIFLNSMAMANITLADNTASAELKSMVEQLKLQIEGFYKAYNQ